jgi:hypothetical protein
MANRIQFIGKSKRKKSLFQIFVFVGQDNRIKTFGVSLMYFYYFFIFILIIFTTHICLVAIKIKKAVNQFAKKHT